MLDTWGRNQGGSCLGRYLRKCTQPFLAYTTVEMLLRLPPQTA